MTTIRIHTRLESDTLTLPELKPMLGMDVEIVVRPRAPMSKKKISAFLDAGKNINIDLDAIMELREASKI